MKAHLRHIAAAGILGCAVVAGTSLFALAQDQGNGNTTQPSDVNGNMNGNDQNANNGNNNNNGVTAPQLPPGVTQTQTDANSGIERAITDITEDALTKNGFSDVIGWLSSANQDRLNDQKNMKVDDLNAVIDQLNNQIQTKYGRSFKAEKSSMEGFIVIVTGQVNDPQQLVGQWPVQPFPANYSDVQKASAEMSKEGASQLTPSEANAAQGNTNGGTITPSDANATQNQMFGGDIKLEKGRDVAVVLIPTISPRNAPVVASLIDETTSWRFDIPHNITATQLHDSLLRNLTHLVNENALPDDFTTAQRQICHSVISAIYTPEIASVGTAR